ncbi:dihydrolipoyl dehydrogenase [Siculibacillus lacustris]|uniref:Dihydrolipoyl dehydrogenase n=1 Tax=Siculibacillus lacustris TaxID=1549641 RepID=A0A4Q9VEP6_9HYPH|nr:dihydrolipoyl dehydrogenase [Siculibacillus lacustris]TBW33278.1 dihydrolipoyl dehydrogenase [Siculibacillus lacustris]
MPSYDVIVIGAGPGGYVTAIRAAQLGFKTAIVEAKHLGGICLNWGCIPTKALLRSAEIYQSMLHAAAYGLSVENPRFDLAAIVERSRGVSRQLATGVGFLLKKNKIDVIWGRATLTAAGALTVTAADDPPKGALGGGDYQAGHIILATGAKPRVLPGLEPDGKLVWTYFDAMVPKTLPKSLLVVGSGAIGIEFASFYNALGVQVTVVEVLDRVLPVEDAEISAFAQRSFEKQGFTILTETKVVGLVRHDDSVTATLEAANGGRREITVDRVISAVGVVGNVENLGLERLGVTTERGCVVIDAFGRSNVAGVYAIGDIAGPPMLAHKAEHEGIVCIEAIAGLHPHPMDKAKIPACTYSHPQVASVGLSEAKAKAAGLDVQVGRFPFVGNGKAIAMGESEGLIKVIFDKPSGELLGAHMIGADVTELIQGYVVAMNLETTDTELIHTVFAHPTLSEMMHEAVMAANGRAIHV